MRDLFMQYENNLVSIITPVYNASKYIREMIDSVLSQTYKNIEFILINDCSTDNSVDIINSYNDSRIRLINNINNLGAALSRNRGIEMAKGRFLAFIDSDDVWESNKLELQVRTLNNTDYVISYTGIQMINDNGEFIKNQNVPAEMTYKKLLRNTAISTSSVVIDRNKVTVPIVMPNRKTGEDYALWLSILRKCGNAKGETDYLLKYRKTKNSLSKNRFDSFGDLWYGQHVLNRISVLHFMFNYTIFAVNAIKKHYF